MSERFAEWRERARNCIDHSDMLRLAQEVADGWDTPQHLATVARQAARALEDYMRTGTDTSRSYANNRFASFKMEIPNAGN